MGIWNWLASWLGVNPDLPFARDVVNPQHGMEAKNSRHQKVIYDEKAGGKWVMPQRFTDRKPVTITRGGDG